MSNNDLAFLLITRHPPESFLLFPRRLIKFISSSLFLNSVILKLGVSLKTLLKLLYDIDI